MEDILKKGVELFALPFEKVEQNNGSNEYQFLIGAHKANSVCRIPIEVFDSLCKITKEERNNELSNYVAWDKVTYLCREDIRQTLHKSISDTINIILPSEKNKIPFRSVKTLHKNGDMLITSMWEMQFQRGSWSADLLDEEFEV